MSSFWIYMIGIAVVAGALSYGAYLLGMPLVWIGIGAAVMLGMGLMGGVRKLPGKNSKPAD